jgi:hypothetical protein
MRALRIDFQIFEANLRSLYFKADHLTFPFMATASSFADRLFSTIYGRTRIRMFMVALLGCVVITLYCFTTFLSDWHQNKLQVDNSIRQAVKEVDPEYFNIVSTEEGRKLIAFAHRQFHAKSGASLFINNDDQSIALRAMHDRFWPRYKAYISSHHLTRVDALDRFFGEAYSNPFW